MIQSRKEIAALLRLIDDPDDEVYDTVSSQILHYGRSIIPDLEHLWEATADEGLQERIELLIHRVHFQDLEQEFREWAHADQPELLRGAILIAKYQFPDMNVASVLSQFDRLRRNIWLELNNYLSPLEQVNVFNSILYNFYKLQGHELTEREPKYFFINQVLESRQGNGYAIGILFLAICEMLDVPVFAVDIPRQFIFAYVNVLPNFFTKGQEAIKQLQFFVDPLNGMVYTHKEVDTYLKKINATEREKYFTPLTTRKVIYKMMEELCLCYRYRKEEQKADEISLLMALFREGDEQQ